MYGTAAIRKKEQERIERYALRGYLKDMSKLEAILCSLYDSLNRLKIILYFLAGLLLLHTTRNIYFQKNKTRHTLYMAVGRNDKKNVAGCLRSPLSSYETSNLLHGSHTFHSQKAAIDEFDGFR
jgi:hypothetical protein